MESKSYYIAKSVTISLVIGQVQTLWKRESNTMTRFSTTASIDSLFTIISADSLVTVTSVVHFGTKTWFLVQSQFCLRSSCFGTKTSVATLVIVISRFCGNDSVSGLVTLISFA